MPIKRPQLVNGEIYHIVLRAVEATELFRDEKDYLRMIHDLFEFNDEDPASWRYRHQYPNYENTSRRIKKRRKMLVEILAFCLMPNHIHLLVRQVQEGGISKFMRKIGAGYGLYYNQRHNRKGRLFGGRYRIVHIKTEEQLKTVFVYIHTNPVALVAPKWKEEGIRTNDLEGVIKFLENYKWSSYSDYLQKRNFPSLTTREFLTKVMGGPEGCREFVNGWLRFKKELADFNLVSIE